MHRPNSELMRRSNRAGVRFLLAEVEAGLTFLVSASQTAIPASRERYVRNAHDIYRVVQRLLPRISSEHGEEMDLHSRMAELRTGLIEAGQCPE